MNFSILQQFHFFDLYGHINFSFNIHIALLEINIKE